MYRPLSELTTAPRTATATASVTLTLDDDSAEANGDDAAAVPSSQRGAGIGGWFGRRRTAPKTTRTHTLRSMGLAGSSGADGGDGGNEYFNGDSTVTQARVDDDEDGEEDEEEEQ